MLLTITTTYQPATDLGYLLHKNPTHLQSFSLNFGVAHVFYPEANAERCTAALLLDIDTVQLVRGSNKSLALEQYVNNRPYVASSFLSVALSEVFGTALNGHCKQRPERVLTPLPLQAQLSVLPSRSGEGWLKRLFEPLGFAVTVTPHLLDEQHPEWGMSPYYTMMLSGICRLSELLTYLYVLIPVLDDEKHYWIGDDEVEKLLRRGKGWLETHPEREHIAFRYLRHKQDLTRDALARLIVEERVEASESDPVESSETVVVKEETESRAASPHDQRLDAVAETLQQSGAKRVLDLGCGEGRLLKRLLQQKNFEHILGMDVSYRALELAQRRLHMERMPEQQKKRITLLHGSLTYRDKRLAGYDAAAVVEVIEHLDPSRLMAFERVLFEFARPTTVVITTPNADYNVKFETLAAGHFRHQDHRFEWTRAQFQSWAMHISERFGYTARMSPIGLEDPEVGALSQMAVFSRIA